MKRHTRDEVQAAKDRIELADVRDLMESLWRLETVGLRLLRGLPDEERNASFPHWGLTLMDQSSKDGQRAARVLGVKSELGSFLYSVAKEGPAWAVGLRAGDRILSLNGRKFKKAKGLTTALSKVKLDSEHTLSVAQGGSTKDIVVRPLAVPLRVRFSVMKREEPNAFAGPGLILFSRGMMGLFESDDDLAVVLGHELAHLTRRHVYSKKSFFTILAATAGSFAVPGLAAVAPAYVGQAVNAKFSREQEREADYFGLQYVHATGYDVAVGADFWERFALRVPGSRSKGLFATHPSSPERLARAKKVAEALKDGRPLEAPPPSTSTKARK